MPQSLNTTYLLDSNTNGSGDKTSRPFWWPGGDGELNAKGTVGGTLVLHQGAPQLSATDRALAASYKPHGSTVTDASTGLADRFWAGEGWFYVELQNTSGLDNCTVWVCRSPSGENTEPYLDDANANPVS